MANTTLRLKSEDTKKNELNARFLTLYFIP